MPIERWLKSGTFIFMKGQTHQILGFSSSSQELELKNLGTNEIHTLGLDDLLMPNAGEAELVFAGSEQELERKVAQRQPPAKWVALADDSERLGKWLKKADYIIAVVETVAKMMTEIQRLARLHARPFRATEELRGVLPQLADCLGESVGMTTYYEYRTKYKEYHGDRMAIALSFRRSTLHRSKQSAAAQHFIDKMILRYYGNKRYNHLRPRTLFRMARGVLARTRGWWIDPGKCGKSIPEDIVEELLDKRLAIQLLLDNPEKGRVLTQITMPSQAWFYEYLRWFRNQADDGESTIVGHYGVAAWENEYRTWDTYVHRASYPLQYVFADHYLLDVFSTDEETRTDRSRLWLTVLIDAYTRCVVGWALLYENPRTESIQDALCSCIWPKESLLLERGIEGELSYYGIPSYLFLDNAWAHHSLSLENLARRIGHNGEFGTIDLVFRPPYKARYGALIERYFGNVSGRIKELLTGSIHMEKRANVRSAAANAILLYQDIEWFILNLSLQYHHTPHSELGNRTPHQMWTESVQSLGAPLVPPRTPAVERLFWRLHPDTRQLGSRGISLFGMHYTSPDLLQTLRQPGKRRPEYSIHYRPSDISRIALFREGHWMCDAHAIELLRPDGSVRPVSLWERELAKELARSSELHDGQAGWLTFVDDIEKLEESRFRERRKIHRQVKERSTSQDARIDVGRMEEWLDHGNSVHSDDYTDLLGSFTSA